MKLVKIPVESLMEVVTLQLQSGQLANLVVSGSSMLPMLREYRAAVQLKPVSERLQPGEIGLYHRDNGQYVLHRVIRLSGEDYLFCGDNQAELETVRHDQLIAVVVGYTRKGKLHSTREPGYGIYCWLWVKLFCLRKYYIWLRRRLARLRNRINNR